MKKILCFIFAVLVLLSINTTVFAGSIPEDLLHSDGAQIFFGEVISYKADNFTVEVCPVKKIKGDVATGTKQYYDNANTVGDFKVKAGNVYLFTYFDENNPTDIFDVTSYDTATLKLNNTTGAMWERFEEYLNEGRYEKAERDRINKINAGLTEVGDEITLSVLTELNNEDCTKIEVGLFNRTERYEIDTSEFYKLADDIWLKDVDNVLAMDTDGGFVIRCYNGDSVNNVTIWDNCTVAGSRVAMNSAPTGDYVIRAEDFNKLLDLLPEEARPELPPLKSLYANIVYWAIYNPTAAYTMGVVILTVLLITAVFIIKHKMR